MANPNTINISRSQDIHYPDEPTRKKFINLWKEDKNYEEALGLIDTSSNLLSKKLTKDIFNQIIDGIIFMEDKYNQDYIEKMQEYLQLLQDNIDKYQIFNTFDPLQQYEKFQSVFDGEYWYFCYNRPPIGTPPTNATYWLALKLKGEVGDNSLGISLTLEPNYWDSNAQYPEKTTISYDYKTLRNTDFFTNSFFVSRRANTRKEPTRNTDDWMELVKVRREHVEYGATEPTPIDYPPFPIKGTVWFQQATVIGG